ncbi:hypothetical protein [Afifella marina]|uniref:Uncharacterized protein n=1 Tax=Afifella marina DSM 2698 TaxID=1120955 RepID=A0A1G5NBA9_AFIMA|nr:hypothetical protein [Afifella marina]MBK1623093.1 hypothetical protein [Afifella marina DSM 2698]MBK1626087.1 hypothetical protein [Afifella marina]MBK5916965.1 hypothetical protein [Afifella marina]RAI21968.1 hypothetical protein CH311_04405 [Afifella marina DSM 2698]SCZ34029.1 hypothetical protein SAMN03080610_01623 [Afifella marina DSM 2698]
MPKPIRSIVLALAASFSLGAVFSDSAHAEDTGLIKYLNAQTRAQVEAYKKGQQKGKAENPSGLGAGIRG